MAPAAPPTANFSKIVAFPGSRNLHTVDPIAMEESPDASLRRDGLTSPPPAPAGLDCITALRVSMGAVAVREIMPAMEPL